MYATGIDLFAPAIGTLHGFYKDEARIDLERLKAIREKIEIPLVLHGGPDLPFAVIESVIKIGVEKINVGTDLKYAITTGLRDFLKANPQEFEHRKVHAVARSKGEQLVIDKLNLYKAPRYGERVLRLQP